MAKIPSIPRMTHLDEEWIDYAAGATGITQAQARGLLVVYYTLQARDLPLAIQHLKDEVDACKWRLKSLDEHAPSADVDADRKMWNDLIPQLKVLARYG